ncbi:Ig-like domain-containing protein [Turneriella parva]|uniref:SbsA Ig-like domain-containing protein n=1 Tax=Turneriella parva (strain ATCC BAA-1111 / DSM 21527 / NCTC 11395 / H) TaxID=869212 RepID=I4B2N8_TURPD|nr:Ig-like domain-containing protein [Turneriella parva]AFM11545.1 hypothetical protein Turpa_0894 [Turneriella parva DSM 21527]
MKKLMVCGVILGFAHCMGVSVPEDFVVDKYYASPTQVLSTSPTTSMSWTTLTQSVQLKFNNPMEAASLTVDTVGDCGSGNIQLLNNRSGACSPLTLTSLEKRNSILVATPSADLDPNTDYTITVKAGVTDFRGAAFGSDKAFQFKSGIPLGQELRVVSVTAAAGTFTGGDMDITVVLSRQLQNGTLFALNDCNSIFTIIDALNACNAGGSYPNHTFQHTGGGTYRIFHKSGGTLPITSQTFRIRQTAIDQYDITLGNDYTVTLP